MTISIIKPNIDYTGQEGNYHFVESLLYSGFVSSLMLNVFVIHAIIYLVICHGNLVR